MALLRAARVAGLVGVVLALGAAAALADPVPAPSPSALATDADARTHRTIATTVPAAQAAFDRGLLLMYAFNAGGAREAFAAAEAADPRAVLPYVGEALSETIDINRPTTAPGEARGAEAVARGLKAAADAPADERALLAAAAIRFDGRRSSAERFSAFDRAMQAYADAHPSDALGATLAAYAAWNATGALVSGAADTPTADARRIAADLDRALAIDPDDLGAHHLRIHFWEEAHRPERALADAQYLASRRYEPGESHLEHMPGHIYARLGMYEPLVAVNLAACANDDAYFAAGRGPGQDDLRGYHDHNVDFVLYGLTTLGRAAEARAFAAHESVFAREVVALRTGDDAAVLRLLGAAITPLRVIAEARAGDLVAARSDLAGLDGRADAVAYALAAAAVALAGHDAAAAVAAYGRAQAAAGTELGDPKTSWWAPIGEGLGAAQLAAGRPADAEATFAAELVRYPHDPRLEFGLAQARRARGEPDDDARRAAAADWQGPRPLSAADLG